jgi:hypothetical protein
MRVAMVGGFNGNIVNPQADLQATDCPSHRGAEHAAFAKWTVSSILTILQAVVASNRSARNMKMSKHRLKQVQGVGVWV